MKPWEPQKGESVPAFLAFAEYRDLGSERSIEAVSRKLSKSIPLLKRWSSRWNWVDRVQAYEAHMDAIEQKAREKALAKGAVTWAERELELADKLVKKANAMLDFPLAQQRSRDGLTIVEPARWGMRDAAVMADAGIKMERLVRGESTENVNVEDKRKQLAEVLGIPLEQVPIDETDRVAS